MGTNTIKIGIPTMLLAQYRKMVWNRLWNPIQGVYMGVATTYFHANYPGTWLMESQIISNWQYPTDGDEYTQNWYSKNDCGLDRKIIWNRLWNPIQGVYKGVATTYFQANCREPRQ
jgi:hypothetical protein